MPYVESYILPVVAARLEEYRQIADDSAKVWLELGALSVMEAKAYDTPYGTSTSFPRAVTLQEGEIVVVAYLTFRDRAHRDEVIAKMESDPRMETLFSKAPVDGKRMIWGGFETIVHRSAP